MKTIKELFFPSTLIPAFLAALDEASQDTQTRLAIRLMWELGLRHGEIFELRWAQFENTECTCLNQSGPYGQHRSIAVPDALAAELAKWRDEAIATRARMWQEFPKLVFFTPKGDRRGPTFMRQEIKTACQAVGWQGRAGVTLLRYIFFLLLYESGASSPMVRRYFRCLQSKAKQLQASKRKEK